MRIKFFLFVLACLVLIVVNAPASLVDLALARLSQDSVRLGGSEGTLWHGRGILVVRVTGGLNVQPRLPLAWHFKPVGLLGGELVWATEPGSGVRGELALAPGGVRLRDFALQAPAGVIASILPVTAAHLGWGGDIDLLAPDWRCSPALACEGNLRLQWRGGTTALLPGVALGDYEIRARGNGARVDVEVLTLAGDIRVSGTGSIGPALPPNFRGSIASPPEVLKLLPNIAGGAVIAQATPGSFVVRYPVER